MAALPTTSGLSARLASRSNTLTTPTSGIAPGHIQANLIVLPSANAADFELLCARNPVPCPLLAKSSSPGNFSTLSSCIPGISSESFATDLDLRTDAPKYNVYIDGVLEEAGVADVKGWWDSSDHVAFLVGCSYSFERALTKAGLRPPHVLFDRNVAMYRTNVPLCPAGRFTGGNYVVSLRMYPGVDVDQVREVTRPYVATHGEPIAWGWESLRTLGIEDVGVPDWGDAPVTGQGELVRAEDERYVPVLWGCGVTPQEAVMRAKIPGVVLGHAPGHMVVLNIKEDEILGLKSG